MNKLSVAVMCMIHNRAVSKCAMKTRSCRETAVHREAPAVWLNERFVCCSEGYLRRGPRIVASSGFPQHMRLFDSFTKSVYKRRTVPSLGVLISGLRK